MSLPYVLWVASQTLLDSLRGDRLGLALCPRELVKDALAMAWKGIGTTWIFKCCCRTFRWCLIVYLLGLALWAAGNPREMVSAIFRAFGIIPSYILWVVSKAIDQAKMELKASIFGRPHHVHHAALHARTRPANFESGSSKPRHA